MHRPLGLIAIMVSTAYTQAAFAGPFVAGNLLVSRTVYAGNASTVTVGQALPGGGNAIANGAYPNVFKNESVDPSFGVTSPIYLDQITTSGAVVSQTAIASNLITSSFASKSELALNISSDHSSVTFMGYAAPANTLDVSNSNTAAVIDPTNPVTSTLRARDRERQPEHRCTAGHEHQCV